MASWNHDGTQDPGPPPMLPDPLSGLVTGGKYDAEAVRIRVVEPSMPDITAVREAMASVLDEDSELRMGFDGPFDSPATTLPAPAAPLAAEKASDAGANDPDAGDGGTGVGPAASSPAPTPPVGIPMLPPVIVESPPRGLRRQGGLLGIPTQRDGRRARPPRPVRRSSWSPGLALVGVLLLVIGVLVIVMLASLIDTISSIFT